MNKSALRKKHLEQRLAMSSEEHKQLNQQLVDMLFKSIDLSDVKYLHIFLPIEKFKEVDTWQIIDRIKRDFPQTKLVIPKVIGDNLEHYIYQGKKQLALDKWGIPEPSSGEQVRPDLIDLILIPLVIADFQGNRIGYGKGYYDRFLSQCRSNAKRIGLSLLPLLEESIYSEVTDVKLDWCVTPTTLKSFF
jgi:5-formyltetrahydrofolate cyclo-ligase